MKMIGHDHFICHSYSHFSVLSHILLSDRTWRSGRSLMTSSDSVSKIISCCFSCFVSDFFYHQYGICRMYSKENPQYFRLPVSGLYPWERVMLLLSAEASFKPCCPFFWEFASKPPSSKAHLGPPFPCAQRMWISHILYRTFCWHYWHIWNRQPHILPLHS